MALKVFISYSHRDETYKETLDEHLSLLKRNEIIDTWNDRRLIAGQKWEDEISESLSESDVIIFLVSSSFISSDSCYALEVNKSCNSIVVPLIIRPCDWTSAEFGSIQGLPKDAIPVSKWENEDDAWLNAVNGIKRLIGNISEKKN